MKDLDLYYSALLDYRQTMAGDRSHARIMQALLKAAVRDDRLETVRTRCVIDEQWVSVIEQSLPYIEKAILEDRQFIRQEGETVPIEKAKKVNKDSVAHLARHSDYISHLPEHDADPLMPDKIYISENESNYAIYENRFLYMLLCYARDFVELRYTKISELGNTYRGILKINKHIEIGKRTITFEATMSDVSKNDRLYEADRLMNDVIERLEAIRVQISALLMTPLMNEVSKAPLLRPPVTRTNILRMNNNFVHAVQLYDYLTAYEGSGYSIQEIKKSFSPFTEQMANEILETVPMLAFLVYKYGNDLEQDLQSEHEKVLAEKAHKEAEKEAHRLQKLREQLKDGSVNIDEFLLTMDSYSRDLEQTIEHLQAEQKKTEARLARMKDEIAWQQDLEQRIRDAMKELQAQNNALLLAADGEKKAYQEEAARYRMECDQRLASAEQAYQGRIAVLDDEHKKEALSLQEKIDEYVRLQQEGEEERTVLSARLHAYQSRCGEQPDGDLTEEESFLRLEKERKWFEDMFRKTWKKTKRRIRRDLLWGVKHKTSSEKEKEPEKENENNDQT